VPSSEAALDSGRSATAFEGHLEEVRDVPREARKAGKTSVTEGHERLSFPSAIFIGEDGERHGVWGFQSTRAYRTAALAAGARQVNGGALPILDAAARFGRLAEPELLTRAEPTVTRAELWRLAAEHRLRPVPVLTGTLWELSELHGVRTDSARPRS
jgi:hypothetical protein